MKVPQKIRRFFRLASKKSKAIYLLMIIAVTFVFLPHFLWSAYKKYRPEIPSSPVSAEKLQKVIQVLPEQQLESSSKPAPASKKNQIKSQPPTMDELLAAARKSTDAEAVYALAELYENGSDLIKRDLEIAQELYGLAADLNLAKAQYKSALMNSEKPDFGSQMLAMNSFAQAAQQNYAPAQLELANIYLEGRLVDPDYAEALALYRKAAEQGLASAELNLGLMYQGGLGIEPDPQKAIEYYKLAAAHGQAQAQYNLGVAYYIGYGVEKDVFKAKEWLNEALKNGNKNSLAVLERINIL